MFDGEGAKEIDRMNSTMHARCRTLRLHHKIPALIMVHGYHIGPFIYYQMTCDSTYIGLIGHPSMKRPFNPTGTLATIGLLGKNNL